MKSKKTTKKSSNTSLRLTIENYVLSEENKQLVLSLKDAVGMLTALSEKYDDDMDDLVGMAVYKAREIIETVEINARARNA